MTPLFKKLNFKQEENLICLNAPVSFASELKSMEAFTKVSDDKTSVKTIAFAMAFVTTLTEIEKYAHFIHKRLKDDGLFWMCYPKSSSKNYTCAFNRDTGWELLGQLGYEPVRQVAIDEDWSALRFRKPTYIKTMTRSFAMTKAGKEKVIKIKTPTKTK